MRYLEAAGEANGAGARRFESFLAHSVVGTTMMPVLGNI
jgi:hypothetical protein